MKHFVFLLCLVLGFNVAFGQDAGKKGKVDELTSVKNAVKKTIRNFSGVNYGKKDLTSGWRIFYEVIDAKKAVSMGIANEFDSKLEKGFYYGLLYYIVHRDTMIDTVKLRYAAGATVLILQKKKDTTLDIYSLAAKGSKSYLRFSYRTIGITGTGSTLDVVPVGKFDSATLVHILGEFKKMEALYYLDEMTVRPQLFYGYVPGLNGKFYLMDM